MSYKIVWASQLEHKLKLTKEIIKQSKGWSLINFTIDMVNIESHTVYVGGFNASFSLNRKKQNKLKNTFYPIKMWNLLDFLGPQHFCFNCFYDSGFLECSFCYS